ncbi:MAG: FAD-binding protein [Acidobacteriota bacterium]|nr:FAD-binding protein [Acidobacteriota bacterium]
MPEILQPVSPEELRDAIGGAAAAKRNIELYGRNTKRLMAGLAAPGGVQISTARLQGIIQYEPRDLTISVRAGTPFAELNRELARNNQMVPLEGAYSDEGTVGGVVAANTSGPRRRLYGTARDLVIGMTFATVDGKLVKSGGMVVKNVAGLDMGKLMIGSFGTLAAIASVNFKVVPKPAAARTLLFSFEDVKAAMAARDAAIGGVLGPAAVDVLNPILAAQFSLKGFVLALLFAGNEAVIERSNRAASAFGTFRSLPVDEEQRFWAGLQNITPRYLEKFREGSVARISTTLSDCGEALASVDGPAHAHAASGIVRGWFTRPEAASRWLAAGLKRGWKGVIEYSGEAAKPQLTLWPEPGNDFAIMKNIKHMFDPEGLLNKGRLYDHI